jgi:hypothetical protein
VTFVLGAGSLENYLGLRGTQFLYFDLSAIKKIELNVSSHKNKLIER